MTDEIEIPAEDAKSPSFDELLNSIRGSYNSREAEIERLRSFLSTLYVNAIRNPNGMTLAHVAFLCHAATSGYSLNRAFAKMPGALATPVVGVGDED